MHTTILIADSCALDNDCLFRRLFTFMPAYRRDKNLSLAAGLLLRTACMEAGIAGAEESISVGEHGKPCFAAYPSLHFSLSHSGERAMCVLSAHPVGCDVEQICEMPPRVVSRVCTPEERDWLLRRPDDAAKAAAFFRLWTLKESYMKMTGQGLSLSPGSISFCMDEASVRLCRPADPACRFFLPERSDGYACACCVQNPAQDACPDVVPVDLAALG